MAPDGGNVTELVAQDGVGLELPVTPSGSRQEIRAVMLTGTGTPVTGLTTVRFDQTVEYREQRAATPTSAAVSRVIRADRLVSDVEEGLSALVEAQFLGNVRFEDESRQATADMVVYDIAGGRVTLESVGDAGRVASVTDATSNIRAPRIELALDASSIAASGGVASVLMPGGTGDDGTADSTSGKMPGLLEQDQEVLVSADSLRYDGDGGQTTYTGQAHLWQGDTSFEGDTLAVDEHTGNLTATGQVRTSIQIVRLDETTQRREASLTRTEADAFVYDDAARRAVYDGEALLRSEHGDLKADRIEVFLEADGRTLDRFEATGNVKLRLDGRWATGEQLVYYEADGRYEMEGAPVEIVEEVAPEETATPVPLRPGATPPPPSCRSTTGRALTFYRSTETVSVDGREERRYRVHQRGVHPADFLGCVRVSASSHPPRMATLRTLNLTKSYGGRTVVRDVNLSVTSGEVVGLLGPNGAGKTTTFYLVVGLTAPDQGRVTLNGEDVTNDPMYLRARKGIGYLPQEPSIFRGLTVEQNILAILETLGLSRAARRRRVRELLEELNLTPLAKSPAHTLSGGERRRAEITRALVISPSFMLLDEPFAGIDPIAVTDIQEIIFHLKARGIGVLITDHNVP